MVRICTSVFIALTFLPGPLWGQEQKISAGLAIGYGMGEYGKFNEGTTEAEAYAPDTINFGVELGYAFLPGVFAIAGAELFKAFVVSDQRQIYEILSLPTFHLGVKYYPFHEDMTFYDGLSLAFKLGAGSFPYPSSVGASRIPGPSLGFVTGLTLAYDFIHSKRSPFGTELGVSLNYAPSINYVVDDGGIPKDWQSTNFLWMVFLRFLYR